MGRSFRRKKERWAEPSNQLANAQKQKGSQIHNWGRLIVNRWGQAFPNALGLLMKLWATFCFLWFFDASFLSVPMPDKKVLSNMCIVHRLRANFHIYNFFLSFDFPRVISTIGTQLCSSQRGDVIVLKRVNKLIVEIKNIKSQRYIYIYISLFCFFLVYVDTHWPAAVFDLFSSCSCGIRFLVTVAAPCTPKLPTWACFVLSSLAKFGIGGC